VDTPENELNNDFIEEQPAGNQLPAKNDISETEVAAQEDLLVQENKEIPEETPKINIPPNAQTWGYAQKPEIKGNTQKISVDELDGQNDQIDLVTVCGVRFESFEDDDSANETPQKNLDIMGDVTMKVTVELGRTKSSVKKVLDMTKGSIVELEKVAGEPVELFVNGKLVGYGEVIVMEDRFGLRVTNIAKPKTLG